MSLHDLINQTFLALTESLERRCSWCRRCEYQVSEVPLREAHKLLTSLQDFPQQSPMVLGQTHPLIQSIESTQK